MSNIHWTESADRGLSSWAIWKLQPPDACTQLGYGRSSPITRIGEANERPDYHNVDLTPNVRQTSWICRQVQAALDVMPPPLAEVLIALWLLPGTQAEIARELGIAFSTLRQRRSEGMLFLEGWLDAQRHTERTA